jgi:long-subunit fatty acid transport protein
MRRTPPRGASLPSLSLGGRAPWLAFLVGVLFGPAAPVSAQDRAVIDLAGRVSLTLGSGARAFGMGGAFLARADDATAASWNPAGLSYLRVPELSLAGNRTLYHNEEVSPDSRQDRFEGQTVDFTALTWPLRFRGLSGAIQASFQRAVPFGGSLTKVEPRPPDREDVLSSGEASGGFDVFAVGTGWRVTRTLRTGITVNRWFNGYTQSLTASVPDNIRPTRVFDTDFGLRGWNTNLGAIWSPLEQVNLGAVFKTPFTGQVSLGQVRTDIAGDGNQITTSYRSNAVRLKFPAAFGFGTSLRPRSALTLSADFTRTFWSRSVISKYFTLSFNPPSPSFSDPPYPSLSIEKPQSNTDQIRLGVEYVFIRNRIKVPLRAGYFNDEQIVLAADGSAPRFNGFTAGVGIIIGPILFDVAYLYESGRFAETLTGEATADVPATTTTQSRSLRTERFFVSLIYRIGGSN